MESISIGFFDSGIGGINVLRESLKILPFENYIYYGDSLHAPYGTKNRDEVKGYILNAVKFMVQSGIKALVVACNTAASAAIKELRETYSFPVIGMEPAVKPAVEKNGSNKRVLVLATPLTLKEEKFQDLVARVDNRHLVDSLALPELVEYAEKFIFDGEIILPYFRDKFSDFNLELYGTVVLGCTHYNFYKSILKKFLPPDMDIIDGSFGTVRNLKNILETRGLINNTVLPGTITYYISGNKVVEQEILQKYQILLAGNFE